MLAVVSPLAAQSRILKIVKAPHALMPREGEAINKLITHKITGNYHSRVNTAFHERARLMSRLGRVDTIKVLALRVEFEEDTSTLTTGNGKMDYKGFLDPSQGLLYDPPHTRDYFEKELLALRNFYLLNSLGKCFVTSTVKPDGEMQCYQLPHDMLYYGDTISTQGVETGLTRLCRDAIKEADLDPTIRFSDYDLVILFHAGSTAQTDLMLNSPFDLLTGTLNADAFQAYLGQPYVLADEGHTKITAASIFPEMARQDTMYDGRTNILGMTGLEGLLAHEFNHLLGGYDLYDVTGYSMGVGSWSIMGYGGWLGDWSLGVPPGTIPSLLDPYHKLMQGWINPLVVNMPKESIPLFAAEMETSDYYRHRDTLNPIIVKVPVSPTEYFLIENRQQDIRHPDTLYVHVEDGVPVSVGDGEYDFFQPGSGVLIWHVDQQWIDMFGPLNELQWNPAHKGVDLVEGDGIQDYDSWSGKSNFDYQIYGSKYDPFFVGGYNDSLSATTIPNSDGYNGKTFMTVAVLAGPDTVVHTLPDSVMPTSVTFDLYQHGFPQDAGRQEPYNPATCTDLDRNGKYQLIVSDTAGRISAWNADGSSYLTGHIAGTFVTVPNATLHSAVTAGDVTGDERQEIVCATDQGRVYVYTSAGGQAAGFPVSAGDRITATPVLFDLDHDGKKEIIAGSTDGKLYVWKGDGQAYPNFPVQLGSEIRSAVVLTDPVNPQIVVLASDGNLFVVNSDGSIAQGFPKHIGQGSFYTYAAPVVGDLDHDGNREIVCVVSGGYDYEVVVLDAQGDIKYHSRDVIRNPFLGSPLLADINGDGRLEIVLASCNGIYAFNHNATLVSNYPVLQDSTYTNIQDVGGILWQFEYSFIFNSSPVVADLDGDGVLDIAIGSPQFGVLLFNSRTGKRLPYAGLSTQGGVNTTPLICDVDGDGKTELAVGSDDGVFHVWKLPGNPASIVWGSWLKDASHDGLYPDSALGPIPTANLPIVRKLHVYPNPAEQNAVVRYTLGAVTNATAKVKILDVSGLALAEFPISADPSTDNEARFNAGAFASGVYVVRLEVNSDQGKIVKFYKLGVVR